MIYPML